MYVLHFALSNNDLQLSSLNPMSHRISIKFYIGDQLENPDYIHNIPKIEIETLALVSFISEDRLFHFVGRYQLSVHLQDDETLSKEEEST